MPSRTPGSWSEQAPRLLAERRAERHARRRAVADAPPPAPEGRGRARGRASGAAPAAGRAGPAKLLLESPERPLVAADELHLELAEPSRRPAALEAAQTASSTTSAPSTRTTSRRVRSRATGARSRPRTYATSSDDELERRPGRRARLLELGAGAPRGSFSCQRPAPSSDPIAKRDAVPGEREIVGVVVRRDEHARRLRLAAELRAARSPRPALSFTSRSTVSFTLRAYPGAGCSSGRAFTTGLVSVNVRARAPVAHAEDERVLRALRPRRRERARGRAARRPALSRAPELGDHAGAGEGGGDRGRRRSPATSSSCSTPST